LYAFIELKLQIVYPENESFVCGEAHFHLNDNVNMQNVGLGPKKSSRNLSASSLTESKGMACRFQFLIFSPFLFQSGSGSFLASGM
jgi:hypothetical protein